MASTVTLQANQSYNPGSYNNQAPVPANTTQAIVNITSGDIPNAATVIDLTIKVNGVIKHTHHAEGGTVTNHTTGQVVPFKMNDDFGLFGLAQGDVVRSELVIAGPVAVTLGISATLS